MIRRPPRSTPLYSSAASDVYKRQTCSSLIEPSSILRFESFEKGRYSCACLLYTSPSPRASQDLVCRLLLEKKNTNSNNSNTAMPISSNLQLSSTPQNRTTLKHTH